MLHHGERSVGRRPKGIATLKPFEGLTLSPVGASGEGIICARREEAATRRDQAFHGQNTNTTSRGIYETTNDDLSVSSGTSTHFG